MQRSNRSYCPTPPPLSKRNDSQVFQGRAPPFRGPPMQQVYSQPYAPLLSPPPFPTRVHRGHAYPSHSAFNPHHFDSFPVDFHSMLRPNRNLKISIRRQFNETNDLFFKNLDDMESQIFGRQIRKKRPGPGFRRHSNDGPDFYLNFSPEEERLNESSQMYEDSVGAEDSPMVCFERDDRPRSDLVRIVPGVNPSLIKLNKKTIVPKSNFLNESQMNQNYFLDDSVDFGSENWNLKKMKSSREMRKSVEMQVLPGKKNLDLQKVVMKEFGKKSEKKNPIIRPKVYHRGSGDKLGSRRTVQSGGSNPDSKLYKVPDLLVSSSRKPFVNSHFKLNHEILGQGNQMRPAGHFASSLPHNYSDFFKQPLTDVRNTLFQKTPEAKPKKPSQNAAQHIYKIMKHMSKIIYDRTLRRDKKRLKEDIQLCLQDVDIQMNHLIGLKNLLSKFMKEEPISEKDMDLSNLEIILFCLFLVKKRFLDLEALRWTPECLNQFRNQEMLKRSEQNYKVVLKRAFKTLISTFNTENSILGANEDEFYKHYFGAVSAEFGIPIDAFKPQQIFNEIKTQKQSGKVEKRKSKKEFALMLKKSTDFMELLQSYLSDELVIGGKPEGIFRDCMKELDRKLPLMIFNWQKRLGNEKCFRDEFIQFLVETLVNDKVKLPWSASEVRRGVSSVLRLFRKA